MLRQPTLREHFFLGGWGLFKIEKGGGLGNINLTDLAPAKILKIRGTGVDGDGMNRSLRTGRPRGPGVEEGRGDAEKGRGDR